MRISGWKLAILAAVLLALGGSALAFHRHRRQRDFRNRLDQATTLLKDRRVQEARRALRALEAEYPGQPEVLYHVGVCEYTRGNLNAAAKAWSEVPLDAPQGGLARYYRARIAIPRGQFVEAEELLTSCVDRPGPHASDARWELVKLLRLQGRFDEARALFVRGIRPDEDLPGMVRMLYTLDVNPVPVEQVRSTLEAAARQSPDDDRVWLARGHLALVQGQLAEADRWLTDCENRRPADVAVASIRLAWALAAGRPDAARSALARIPADPRDPETEAQAIELAAWFARQRGDAGAERRFLERRAALRPQDAPTLERLAELAAARDERDLVASYRERKQELDPLRKRYEELLGGKDPGAGAAELETLSRRLGRVVDARLWQTFLDVRAGKAGTTSGDELPSATDPGAGTTLAVLVEARLQEQPGDPKPEASREQAAPAASDAGPPVPRFVDEAAASGLVFTHRNGDVGKRLIPPVTASGGVALLDYDGDGRLDVFAVQSGPFPPDPKSPHDGDRLFRNLGDGRWEDVTAASGLAAMPRGYGHGATVGDYDNDGRPDLLVTRWRSYALYHNRGDGTFETARNPPASRETGTGPRPRPSPTSTTTATSTSTSAITWAGTRPIRGPAPTPTIPRSSAARRSTSRPPPDHLFRNDGGRFVDVTEAAGIRDTDGRGLGVLAADLNEDGKVDLFVANDMTANYLFLNRGGLKFEEVAHAAGVAGNASGGYQAGMGVACGDLNRDGRPDVAVTNFYNEGTTYFENLGQELFADRADIMGIRAPSRYLLGFGVAFLDANNDGWLDLISANGHVNDGRPSYPWKMPLQLLLGGKGDG
ncbi:MAG: FG-GAP-like repeat-containing protein [Isosphaeraceae bacterium]